MTTSNSKGILENERQKTDEENMNTVLKLGNPEISQ